MENKTKRNPMCGSVYGDPIKIKESALELEKLSEEMANQIERGEEANGTTITQAASLLPPKDDDVNKHVRDLKYDIEHYSTDWRYIERLLVIVEKLYNRILLLEARNTTMCPSSISIPSVWTPHPENVGSKYTATTTNAGKNGKWQKVTMTIKSKKRSQAKKKK